ncbi:unnamed protein product, partial [marine sediment metagenome]
DLPEGSSNLYQLTGEEVDDYVYALINDADSVHTLITITYDDINDAYDFVVNNNLSLYSNAVSLFITKSVNDLDYYYLKTETDTLLAALKFTDLDDTPASYEGQAGKYVKVNAGETDLEFGTGGDGAGTFLELTDTPGAYDNGKYAKSTAEGVIWDTPAGAGTVTTSGIPEVNDIARFTGATVIEGLTYDELTTALALNSDDLSDVDSIAMLDESETVTDLWTFTEMLTIVRETNIAKAPPVLYFERREDGDP